MIAVFTICDVLLQQEIMGQVPYLYAPCWPPISLISFAMSGLERCNHNTIMCSWCYIWVMVYSFFMFSKQFLLYDTLR